MRKVGLFTISRIFLTGLLILSFGYSQNKVSTVTHDPIKEQSALVKSETYPDVYWVCNDSGDDPRLFPLTESGEIIIPNWLKKRYRKKDAKPYPGIKLLGAENHDWETMTTLGDTLILGDVGNNGNARRDLGLYVIPEPNPYDVDQTRPLNWIPVHYEDQKAFPPEDWTYDCESIFSYEGKIYFLTKHRRDAHISKPDPSTHLYRLDSRDTDRSNPLKYLGRADNLGGWVTGADMAPDGSGMVFVALNMLVTEIWFFPTPRRGDNFLASKPRSYSLLKANQVEAVCFKDSKTLLLSNEQRDWFEVPLKLLK